MAAPGPILEARLLGRTHFTWRGERVQPRSRKSLALLVYLSVQQVGQTRECLAELLWGSPKRLRNVRQALFELRTLPGVDTWLEQSGVVELRVHSDLADFETALVHGRLADALELWAGPPFERVKVPEAPAFNDWLEVERNRIEMLYLGVLQARALELEEEHDYETALSLVRELLKHDDLNETAHRTAMRLERSVGNLEAAVAQFELCRRKLKEELGVEPLVETKALLRDIQRDLAALQPLGTKSKALVRNFPSHRVTRMSFVGREQELSEIGTQLVEKNCRLLSLVGPGGSGKTHLALQVTEKHTETFGHGTSFVSLAPVAKVEYLPLAVASALNIRLSGRMDPTSQLVDYLHDKHMLLVMDNFEHLLEGVGLLAELITHCPNLTLLVTSREPLDLSEEWCFKVSGMSYPTSGEEEFVGYDAVQLFVQRARQADIRFRLTSENHNEVLRIIRVLAGLPLGIELVASWLRHLTPQEIAGAIEENLALLEVSSPQVPERHRSLKAAFDHSWHLLPDPERETLKRLAVFRGGFEYEAAKRVTSTALRTLLTLANKSLLRRSDMGRFEMLEPIRQFALEHLTAAPELQKAVLARHVAHYTSLLAGEGLQKGPDREALRAVDTELDNVRAAWNDAVAKQDAYTLERSMNGLFRFFQIRSLFHEGWTHFGDAVAAMHDANNEALVAGLMARQAFFGLYTHFAEDAAPLLERSVAVFRRLELKRELAQSLPSLALTYQYRGDYEAAKGFLQECLDLHRELDDAAGQARALCGLGVLARLQGRYDTAEGHYRLGLGCCEPGLDDLTRSQLLSNLGNLLRLADRPEEAVAPL